MAVRSLGASRRRTAGRLRRAGNEKITRIGAEDRAAPPTHGARRSNKVSTSSEQRSYPPATCRNAATGCFMRRTLPDSRGDGAATGNVEERRQLAACRPSALTLKRNRCEGS